ncbi:MAG TPA: uroporphyrinogen decarboxylase [Terriglobales bacterium]|nr:uroporphyrinogen decarboxylase [Terriglobales bacterium]
MTSPKMTSAQRFAAACRHQPVDRPPVWLLRQAGRYMPEYRAVRARHSLLEICHSPALAAEVTITAAERLATDAAIIFADLLLPAAPLGIALEFTAGEGPQLSPPLRTPAQIAQLPTHWDGALGYVSQAIGLVHRHFAGDLPVVGFAGAPFTLASYLIEGGGSRHYIHTKRLMYNHPQAWDELMAKLVAGLAEFLTEQAVAGAAAVQLFDSWAGALSEADYRRFVLPHNQRLVAAVQRPELPVIYFSTGTAAYLEAVAETGAQVLSLEWRIDLTAAWDRLARWSGAMPALQGNLDPVLLLADRGVLHAAVQRQLQQARGRSGYIFNLGHGILPETPVEHVRALVDWVRAEA